MPHAAFTLSSGADTNQTYAMNQAGLSLTQLIRYMPDSSGKILVQKMGGWSKTYPYAISSTVYNLWAWQDLNATNRLAVGAKNSLSVITNGQNTDITPRILVDNFTPNFSTVINTNVVTVIDTGSGQTVFNFVWFEAPVAVVGSGIVLSGIYPIYQSIDNNTYTIQASINATATINNVGAMAYFTTVSTKSSVNVLLTAHGYQVGSTFSVPVAVTVGGITLSGLYQISAIVDANNFTIVATASATSSASAYENSNLVLAQYYIALAPPSQGSGFGSGGFGSGGFGTGITPTANLGSAITATDWSLDNFGQILVGCPAGGGIYYWQPGGSIQNGQLVGASAPPVNDGIFVAMPQRQIIAWGSTVTGTIDPLLVRWCDVQDFTTWTGLSTNQAGQFRLPRGSRIVGGIQSSQQGLLWTDLGVWSMSYVSQPFIYSFNEIGNGCGLISRKAMGTNNNVTYWMSQSQFFRLSGGGVEPLPCPIWDVIFQKIDMTNTNSIRCAVNSRFNEVSWFYPTVGSNGVNTNYIKYNFLMGVWDFGILGRTAWINQSVLGPPIGAGTDNYIYQHEVGNDADTQPMAWSYQTGFFALAEGDQMAFIDQMWPDMKWGLYNGTQSASVNFTFYGLDYPGDTPTIYGPYAVTSMTEYFSPRIRNRLVSIGVSGNDFGTFSRIGQVRYRYMPDGKY